MPWYTYVEVVVTGKATGGAAPIEMTLEIYDGGVLVGNAVESDVELRVAYFTSLRLGGPNGNVGEADVGIHSVMGKVILRNPEGEVVYETDTLTFGIGVVPGGEVW